MKHTYRRLGAAALALSLLLGQGAVLPALASDALGWDLHAVTIPVSEGVTVTRGYFWSDTYSDLRTERYLTYTPGETVTPAVAYGDAVLTKATLTSMAKSLEEKGRRVVGGVNGDFYVVATGEPLGLVVTDGVVRSSSSYHYAVGFRADGTAFLGKPELAVTAEMGGLRVPVTGGINKVRKLSSEGGGLLLLTGDFGKTTRNTAPGVDVILRPMTEGVGESVTLQEPIPAVETDPAVETEAAEETGTEPAGSPAGRELSAETEPAEGTEPRFRTRTLTLSDTPRIGSRVRCVVEEVIEAQEATPIPEGCFVLTLNGEEDPWLLELLHTLEPGTEVAIDLTTEDPRWEEAKEAIGGMYRLLENGEIPEGLNAQQTARTAIGIREDGTVLLYTMDGRQPGYSVGAAFAQVARRLLELGCVEALGLDGGGSTTLGLTGPADDSLVVVNRPSDGSQRTNSTALFLTTALAPTGVPAYLQVSPTDALLLSGAELPLWVTVVDTGYRAMGVAGNVTYIPDGNGTIKGNIFTAGEETETVTVTARQGELTGRSVLTVIRTPDRITVRSETTGQTLSSLPVSPNETVDLTASASWRNLALTAADDNFTWACDETVGTVDETGRFTAGPRTASGNLTVTAGERTLTIPVNVVGHILPLEDFETMGGTEPCFTGDRVTASVETDLAHVRMGRQSLRLCYDLTGGGSADLPLDLAIPAGERYVGLWVLGDGSAHQLVAAFTGEDRERLAPVAGLTAAGWTHILIPVPEGMDTLSRLRVVYGGAGEETGTAWVDHLTTANEEVEDLTPPQVTLQRSGETLVARVSDNVDRSFGSGAVTLTVDGKTAPASWNQGGSVLTALLPGEEGTHRLTVTAVDVSGNLGRASLDWTVKPAPAEPDDEPPVEPEAPVFADTRGHWAEPYALYLYEQGVTKGTLGENETVVYLPNANITRAEFFTMVARWMGLDLTEYEDDELPFRDMDQVPEWAKAPLAAMYDRGIVKGDLKEDGLYADPNVGISRAQVMTILGRTQARGYPERELETFTDGGAVPDWAGSYVRTLVGQGIINGYEDGSLRPAAPMTRGEVAKVLYALR